MTGYGRLGRRVRRALELWLGPGGHIGLGLKDGSSVRHVFADGTVLNPGEFTTVFGGGSPTGFSGKVYTASTGGLGLANTGDEVSLLDAAAGLVDFHAYA